MISVPTSSRNQDCHGRSDCTILVNGASGSQLIRIHLTPCNSPTLAKHSETETESETETHGDPLRNHNVRALNYLRPSRVIVSRSVNQTERTPREQKRGDNVKGIDAYLKLSAGCASHASGEAEEMAECDGNVMAE